MGVVQFKVSAMLAWVFLIVLIDAGRAARKTPNIEDSIRDDPDLSEVFIGLSIPRGVLCVTCRTFSCGGWGSKCPRKLQCIRVLGLLSPIQWSFY